MESWKRGMKHRLAPLQEQLSGQTTFVILVVEFAEQEVFAHCGLTCVNGLEASTDLRVAEMPKKFFHNISVNTKYCTLFVHIFSILQTTTPFLASRMLTP
jgi:hypothetical protein